MLLTRRVMPGCCVLHRCRAPHQLPRSGIAATSYATVGQRHRFVDHLGETFHRGRPLQPEGLAAGRLPECRPACMVDRERRPRGGELALAADKRPCLAIQYGVSQAGHIEPDRRCATDRRFGDDDTPALDHGWMHEHPRGAQQPVLLLLADPSCEDDAGPSESLEALAFRTVTGDDQLPADNRPHPVPQPQQEVQALVVGEPPEREEHRLGRARQQRTWGLDTVEDEPDVRPVHPDLLQSGGRGRRDRQEQVLPVRPWHQHVLREATCGRDRRRETQPPQLGVHVVDEAQCRAARPQGREIGHSVADLHDEVAVAQVPPVHEGRPEELAVGTAATQHPVGTLTRGSAAEEGDAVAVRRDPLREPVDKHLRAACPWVGKIPPCDEQDMATARGRAVHPVRAGPLRHRRQGCRQARRPAARRCAAGVTAAARMRRRHPQAARLPTRPPPPSHDDRSDDSCSMPTLHTIRRVGLFP